MKVKCTFAGTNNVLEQGKVYEVALTVEKCTLPDNAADPWNPLPGYILWMWPSIKRELNTWKEIDANWGLIYPYIWSVNRFEVVE